MNVLVVEDIFLARKCLKQVLDREGYLVDEAQRASTALMLIQKNKYKCIFVDLGLPDMDGIELIRKIRSMGYDSKIIVTSGQSEKNTLLKCVNAGADNYLVKPIDYDRMKQILVFS